MPVPRLRTSTVCAPTSANSPTLIESETVVSLTHVDEFTVTPEPANPTDAITGFTKPRPLTVSVTVVPLCTTFGDTEVIVGTATARKYTSGSPFLSRTASNAPG